MQMVKSIVTKVKNNISLV